MMEVDWSLDRRSYVNVMETLVAQEATNQFQDVPASIRRYVKHEEVVTYALNRLPALYASSERGLEYQQKLAEHKFHKQIRDAVRQAIAAVQIDPIRVSQPLKVGYNQDAEAVLKFLQALFRAPDLDWSTALKKLETLNRQAVTSAPEETTVESSAEEPSHWQPGTYGNQAAWKPKHQQPANKKVEQSSSSVPASKSGWDSVFYRL
jgi:hypothetical protein